MSCYVIVLNYNGWRDTIECLDTLFQSNNSAKYKVVVCDNNSTDSSIENIKLWLDDSLDLLAINPNPLVRTHLQEKPSYIYWDRPKNEKYDSPLLLVKSEENRGFAAGNNIGIKIAMQQDDCETMFILNNDTVVDKDTIYEGVAALHANPHAGICSVNAKCYDKPDKPNWYPMYYDPDTGKENYLTKNHQPSSRYLYKYTGMAFFVTKKFIEDIGLMNETYFLYYEELDWTVRCKNKFSLITADKSIVYHKGGATASPQSPLSWLCTVRSLFLFVKRYYPEKFPKIYFLWCLRCLKRFLEGNFSHGLVLLKFLIIFPFKGKKYTGGFFTYKNRQLDLF